MTTFASQALVWARSRSLQALKAKFDEAPVISAVLVFLVLTTLDLIVGTSAAWVFLMLAALAATLSCGARRFRRSPVQKRLASLAATSLQRFVTVAEIMVEPPLVGKTGSLILMVDRRSRQVSEQMEVYRLLQEGALRHKFCVPSVIRFHRDGVAEIQISRNDLHPLRIKIDLRGGTTRLAIRETIPAERNPFVNQVLAILATYSLDTAIGIRRATVADIRKARIQIAKRLQVDTCPPNERSARTAAMAYANDRLDACKKEIFGQ